MAKRDIPEDTLRAQRRASHPQGSSWASANAGAGKTFVLTARVARLLLAGTMPDRILCITYTKAAAAEMKARLFGMLGKWSTLSDNDLWAELRKIGVDETEARDLTAARQLFARALETPGGLKIQTIHSFCQLVLSRFPLEAGIPPAFDILDDHAGAVLLSEARDHVLTRALDGSDAPLSDAIETIASLTDEGTFDQILAEIRQKAAVFETIEAQNGLDQALARLHDALGIAAGTDETTLLLDALCDQVLDTTGMRAAAAQLREGKKTDTDRGDCIAALLSADDRAAAYPTYREAFLTQKGEARKTLATKDLAAAHPTLVTDLEREQDRILALEDRRRAVRLARSTGAMLVIANRYRTVYGDLKRRQGALDYDDLVRHTHALLHNDGTSAWILYKLDAGIDHVLVDEAQDTSPRQWSIIERLTEDFFAGLGPAAEAGRNRTVFAVGDEKQSIYSFQGAEPAAFGRMKAHFEAHSEAGGAAWDPVTLSLSFRSAPQILHAVDYVFADEISRRMVTGANEPVNHDPLRREAAGLVEVWPLVSPNDAPGSRPWDAPLDREGTASPPVVLATRIARSIGALLKDATALPSTEKRARPKDVLILVRRRNAFVDTLIRTLKEHRIPVAGADRLLLTEHIAVMDLIALGECLLLPQDDLTLATVLKSPFFDWSEDDLYDLAQPREMPRLWTALGEGAADRPLWRAAHDRLCLMRERAGVLPPFEFYAWLLAENDGFSQLVKRLGMDAVDPIEEFLTLAQDREAQGLTSLQTFLHDVRRDPPEIKRDMDAGGSGDDQGEVRIMTVHGAKGLEAPIVILPDTTAKPDGAQDDKIITAPEDDRPDERAPVFWPVRKDDDTDASAALRAARANRREAEYRRLLYVAMTRAEDRLYVCGYHSKRPPAEGCWYSLIETALKPHADLDETAPDGPVMRLGTVPLPGVGADGPPAEPDNPLPEWLTKPAPVDARPPRTLGPSQILTGLDEADPGPVISPLARAPESRFLRGRLIHKLLERLPDLPPDDRRAAGARYLRQAAHGFDDAEADAVLEEVAAIMDDPAFAPLFGPDSRAEVPITGRLDRLGDGIVIDGKVDRLVIDGARVLIADYKTNRPAPVDLGAVPDAYLVQMALYRALLQEALPGRQIACALIWTDGPHRLTLPDAALDQALSRLMSGPAALP